VWFLRVDYLTDDENTKIIEIVQQIKLWYLTPATSMLLNFFRVALLIILSLLMNIKQ
jgi:hypothetical protein